MPEDRAVASGSQLPVGLVITRTATGARGGGRRGHLLNVLGVEGDVEFIPKVQGEILQDAVVLEPLPRPPEIRPHRPGGIRSGGW